MIWNPKRRDNRRSARSGRATERRSHRAERLESRQLLAADPIHLGVVYLETDYLESDLDVGGDSRGDRFILSFTGGAPDTRLGELRIRTDKDGDGISVGDPIFDTELGGRGKSGAHGFQLLRVYSATGESIDAVAEVSDGGQELILRLTNFRAGDRLEFSIDVDEVLRNSADLNVFNDRLDVITSGQEFQDSILEATFHAPRFEVAEADAVFLNDFGDPAASHGLNLPADEGPNIDSRPNRSAAALASAVQTPKPIAISGTVWIDNDLNAIRQVAEATLPNVEIALWQLQTGGSYVDTGLRTRTDANGRYEFPTSLGLMPGTYRVIQSQPADLVSVAAVPGTVTSGNLVTMPGIALSLNDLADIEIPLGDSIASQYDFAEAQRATLSGRVFIDDDGDGKRDPAERGMAGVRMELIPIETLAPQPALQVTTGPDGTYQFTALSPGRYEVIQVEQPALYRDGVDLPGTVGGRRIGVADNPGDRIAEIVLAGADVGIDYDFGEIPLGSISGTVYLAAPGVDCEGVSSPDDGTPLPDVELKLIDTSGQVVAITRTDSAGQYRFEDVPPGSYRIAEQTPESLFDGASHPGRIGEVSVGTSIDGGLITNVNIAGGAIAEEFNFCEAAPASIRGTVYHDRNDNGTQDRGEEPIANVTITLLHADGRVVIRDQTGPDGTYAFEGLQSGSYTLQQSQPSGWLDGRDHIGLVDGERLGTANNDQFTDIVLRQGQHGTEYNFGERLPASIAGRVIADADGDCVLDPNESPIGGVTIRLLDSTGSEVAQTLTRPDGTYVIEGLNPGRYTLVQDQPQPYFDGDVHPGTAGGTISQPNRVDDILLGSGVNAIGYDFCEVPPASIAGQVWQESVVNGQLDPSDQPLAKVSIELLDSTGAVIRTTTTDEQGRYQFVNLHPGSYSVRELQPGGLFHGGETVGTAGGRVVAADLLGAIELRGGTIATGYDFYEVMPASLSGHVFQDGEPIQLASPPNPIELRQYRDGLRTDDDQGLSGVVLELRDVAGFPIDSSNALAGLYPDGPIRVSTDNDGSYLFSGLRPGIYHVYQWQPDDYLDGLDTAGTSGGFAVNAADPSSADEARLVQSLSENVDTHPRHDAILNIMLVGGAISLNNDFSEILLVDPPAPKPTPPQVTPPLQVMAPPVPSVAVRLTPATSDVPLERAFVGAPLQTVSFFQSRDKNPPMTIEDEWAVSWHLSVINGGYPRGAIEPTVTYRNVSVLIPNTNWKSGQHRVGKWVTANDDGSLNLTEMSLGEVDAIALAGDFNGDGADEAVIYVGGQWYVDVNGNGRWDAGDLWIGLGTELDRPVVGDWDGDGKDDIGIYGRQWRQDPDRITHDPGLPDPANIRRRRMIESVSHRTAAERALRRDPEPPRWMRRKADGELRADAVDHVFQYGEQTDQPVVGDWNGDGIDQIAVFRAGQWLLDQDGDGRRSDEDQLVEFGRRGDQPVAGDFNGDGIDEIGVVRGQWWIIDTDGDRRLTGNDLQIRVPREGANSQPVVADWDGDGKDEPGYYSTQTDRAGLTGTDN